MKDLLGLSLNDNKLTGLPAEITKLTLIDENGKGLRINNNRLCDISPEIEAWIDKYSTDPYWRESQFRNGTDVCWEVPNRDPCSNYTCDSLVARAILDANGHGSDVSKYFSVEDDRITQLTQFSNGYGIRNLTKEIGKLAKLETIDIVISYYGFSISMDIPTQIGQLSNLRVLRISSDLKTIPSEIGQLTSLEELSITGSAFDLPSEIYQLSNLRVLVAVRGAIKSLPPEFAQLKSLNYLNLNGNSISNLPIEIMQLDSLNSLSINSNNICEPSEVIEKWIDTYSTDSTWRATQNCP